VAGNRDFLFRIADSAGKTSPDLICLPEAFTAKGVAIRDCADIAESVPGPTTDLFAAIAKRYSCYIVCPIYRRSEPESADTPSFHNSAVLLDRNGGIAGIYDKMRPCTSTPDYTVLENGVEPGDGGGYFDVDFGRIGIRICMDVHFARDWDILASAGVRLVLWPSAYGGGLLLQARALIHNCFIIAAVRQGCARVVDPCGHVTAETAPGESFITAGINLDFAIVRRDFHQSIASGIKAAYGDRVNVHDYPEENMLLIEPEENAILTSDLKQEFGFETAQESIRRLAAVHERLRADHNCKTV